MKKTVITGMLICLFLLGCFSQNNGGFSVRAGNQLESVNNMGLTALKELEKKELTIEDIQKLAAKHGELEIGDFSPYMDLAPLQETGSLSELLEFTYKDKKMYMRISASDKKLAAAPYEGALDHAIIFSEEFLNLDTVEKEFKYDGSCADIRSGNLEHILNGTVEMSDYITFELPDGLSQSGWKYWIGSHGGVYFTKNGETEKARMDDIGLFAEKPSVGGMEIWQNGQIPGKTELIKESEPVKKGDVTIKRGKYQTEQEISWYIAYTECQKSHISYCFYLSSEEFTEEDFIKISDSIQLQDNAIY